MPPDNAIGVDEQRVFRRRKHDFLATTTEMTLVTMSWLIYAFVAVIMIYNIFTRYGHYYCILTRTGIGRQVWQRYDALTYKLVRINFRLRDIRPGAQVCLSQKFHLLPFRDSVDLCSQTNPLKFSIYRKPLLEVAPDPLLFFCDRELRSMTLTFDLDPDSVKCPIYRSKVISFRSYCPNTPTRADIHTRPLKWLVNI